VTAGGPGAWEIVTRYSALDLTDALIEGGEMSRVSLGANWYATSSFKATVQYGWIDLDRFGIRSTTRVLQIRAAFLLGL
jgi:phosphate-selective porin OprO/OprP